MDILIRTACILIGYLFGCINPAYIVGRLHGRMDIRSKGSNSAGTSNAFLLFGPRYGIFVFIIDALKTISAGYVTYFIYRGASDWQPIISGADASLPYLCVLYTVVGCILGHDFPFYMSFRGGKGAACWIAGIFMLDWRIFLPCLVIGFFVGLVTKYMAVATLTFISIAAVLCMIISWDIETCVLLTLSVALAFFLHRANFTKIRNGTEILIYKRK